MGVRIAAKDLLGVLIAAETQIRIAKNALQIALRQDKQTWEKSSGPRRRREDFAKSRIDAADAVLSSIKMARLALRDRSGNA